MSVDSAADVQAGVFTRLTGFTALTGLLAGSSGGIMDYVPERTEFPYVVIGEASSIPMDTQRVSGNDVTLTIHVYSRELGMQQARHIMAAIYDALHNISFSIPNQNLVLCRILDSKTELDGDGITRHGIQRFQIITEPV